MLHNDHSAWANGEPRRQLHAVLGRVGAGAALVLAGMTRVEHVCKPSAMGRRARLRVLDVRGGVYECVGATQVEDEYFAAYAEPCSSKLHGVYEDTEPWF